MKVHSYGWWIHAGVKGGGVNKRYTQGGLSALHQEDVAKRKEAQEYSHRLAYKKWGPEYINRPGPGKRLICKWRRMLDDFVPDWEQLADWRQE